MSELENLQKLPPLPKSSRVCDLLPYNSGLITKSTFDFNGEKLLFFENGVDYIELIRIGNKFTENRT